MAANIKIKIDHLKILIKNPFKWVFFSFFFTDKFYMFLRTLTVTFRIFHS
jgi:hypothetical protein